MKRAFLRFHARIVERVRVSNISTLKFNFILTKTKTTFVLTLLLIMSGCNSNKSSLPGITGSMYEVLVVMDHQQWISAPGRTLVDLLDQDMEALPQPEPVMDIIPCRPEGFSNMFKSSRNIIISDISEKYSQPKVVYARDKWAHPQAIVRITAPNDSSFVEAVQKFGKNILDFFITQERQRQMEYNKSFVNLEARAEIEKIFGIQIDIPSEFKKAIKKKDFYWITNDNPKIRKDIVIYSYPYTDKNTFTKDYLLAKRDSVMKYNVQGEIEGSYMGTEYKYYPPIFREIWVNGGYCAEIRGLWKMFHGAAMGGPFYSHTRLDEINQRVITIEGFVFAPGEKKRNAIRQLESVVYSAKLPQEINALKEISVTPKK